MGQLPIEPTAALLTGGDSLDMALSQARDGRSSHQRLSSGYLFWLSCNLKTLPEQVSHSLI